MKNSALTLLLFLLVLLSPVKAFSAAESMGMALNIVEDFTREANTLMESRGMNPLSPVMKDKTLEALREIRLTEGPGKQRSAKVYGLVSNYTEKVITTVRTLKSTWSGNEAMLSRLEKLRVEKLTELSVLLASESGVKAEPKPVPGFDLSPHDEPATPGNEKTGIMFR